MEKNAESEEEDEEPLDDYEYWEPYWEAVEEYWRICVMLTTQLEAGARVIKVWLQT